MSDRLGPPRSFNDENGEKYGVKRTGNTPHGIITDTGENPINPATEETVSQLVMAITNAIDETAYDLNVAAFSETTALTNDYELDNVEFNFTTAASRTITITTADGTLILNEIGNTNTSFVWKPSSELAFNGGENLTVTVTQTGSACLMACILKTKSGTNTLSGNPVLGAGANLYGIPYDFFLEICRGNIPGMSCLNKFGHTENVGTSLTDIWNDGGLYSFPLSASTMTLSSGSANDTSAGTGARTVEVFGLDTDYNEISEIIFLNGQTPVTSANSYLRVFRMIVRSGGSTGENEGNIYFGTGTVTAGVPANIYAEIIFDSTGGGENQTLMAIYTIPAGKTGYLFDYDFSTTQNKPAEMWIKVRPFGEVFQTKVRTMIYQNKKQRTFKMALEIIEKSDIRASGATDAGTTDVSADFSLILIDNSL